MKKILTLPQFQKAISQLKMTEKTKIITKAAMVEGVPVPQLVLLHNVTKAAIYNQITRIWKIHQIKNLPPGYKQIEAILPQEKAAIVEQWHTETVQKLNKKGFDL